LDSFNGAIERWTRLVLRTRRLVLGLWLVVLVVLFILGLSAIVSLPLAFAAATIAATPGIVFAVAHVVVMATNVTNLIELIGFALAIDYSLLAAYRFREELAVADEPSSSHKRQSR
jgi:uncharacterized membrane protein YdfJ with MMPL/SSD domain